MKELLEIIRARRASPDLPFALATVMRVEGSSYRKAGARMLVSLQGRVAGSVSGGCLEKDVISRARAVILDGGTDLAVYDTTDQDDMAFGTSLGCEGRIEILIRSLAPGTSWPLADHAEKAVRERRALALATVYRAVDVDAERIGQSFSADDLPRAWSGLLAPAFEEVLARRKPLHRQVNDGSVDLLIERLAPPARLVLFGGGDDVPPLVRLAKEMGHHVTVIDRRAEFADPARFPGADFVKHAKPHEIDRLGVLEPDAAAVIMNHHYETDSALLAHLVAEPLAYLGMLGPRRRTVKILREAGGQGADFTPADLEKLHAPVGLDLGSETPEQIALCILAEIQAVLAGRAGVRLRDSVSLIEEVFSPATKLSPA
jgi:xanthine/CO dehydrogenase XdhC/CoxF family maturation factor